MSKLKHVGDNEDFFDLMGKHILILGNPLDGFEYYGPFKTGEDAIDFGNNDELIGGSRVVDRAAQCCGG